MDYFPKLKKYAIFAGDRLVVILEDSSLFDAVAAWRRGVLDSPWGSPWDMNLVTRVELVKATCEYCDSFFDPESTDADAPYCSLECRSDDMAAKYSREG